MGLETSFAIYLILWWVVLFTILPLGVVSHAEAGIRTPGGGDPGAELGVKGGVETFRPVARHVAGIGAFRLDDDVARLGEAYGSGFADHLAANVVAIGDVD